MGLNPGNLILEADDITDMAIDWIDSTDGESNFLWVHYMDVHHPYHPPEEYQLEFRDSAVSKRRSVKLRRKMLENPHGFTDEELRTLIDLYDGEIRFFDHEARRLIDETKEKWGQDTVVGVTSDHGDEFLDHHGFSHYDTFYDELLHVPLVVDVGNKADTKTGAHEGLVSLVDIAPTLLDCADADIPDNFYGESLLRLTQGDEWNREYVIAENELDDGRWGFGCRTSEWKYIVNGHHPDSDTNVNEELYSIKNDPGETENVIDENEDVAYKMNNQIENHKRLIEKTDQEIQEVEVDERTERRLEGLGYK